MDYSYYNTNNEKVRLDIKSGTKWDNSKVQNSRLNSIFKKIDNGDGIISEEESVLLNKLLSGADGAVDKSKKNNILENNELDEILKQIQDGKTASSQNESAKNTPEILSHIRSVTRSDGIKLTIEDDSGDIAVREDGDYSTEHSTVCGILTVTDKDGKEYQFGYTFGNCWNKDIYDCRQMAKNVCEYLKNLPQETIDKLISSGVKNISFTDDFKSKSDKYIKSHIDKNGDVIDIQDNSYSAVFISSKFKLPERQYGNMSFDRADGYKFNIVNTSDMTSDLTITFPSGKRYTLHTQGDDKDLYHQWQLPKLRSILQEMPENVLEDLSNEVTDIKFSENGGEEGAYFINTNQITLSSSPFRLTDTMTLVHEIGHAIDNQNGIMLSSSHEFTQNFDEFKTLLTKFYSRMKGNHACDNPAEWFASYYAYKQMPEDQSSSNHIRDLEEVMSSLKASNDPEQRKCYKLYEKLKQKADNYINNTYKLSAQSRKYETLSTFIKTECKDLLEEMTNSPKDIKEYITCHYPELELANALYADDELFNKIIESYRKIQNNELTDMFGKHKEVPEEISNLFGKLADRLPELRQKIKK